MCCWKHIITEARHYHDTVKDTTTDPLFIHLIFLNPTGEARFLRSERLDGPQGQGGEAVHGEEHR